MTKRHLARAFVITGSLLLAASGIFPGCSRNEPPPPPQSGPPAMAVPQAQAPAPAPAVQPMPQQPMPQQPAAPQMAAPQPQPAPAAAPASAPTASPAQPQMAPAPTVAPSASPAPGAFSQVTVGMSSQQVLQLLGNPSRVKPKGQYVEWEYWSGGRKFELKLQADQVVAIENH